MLKSIKLITFIPIFLFILSFTAHAGTWRQDDKGWWYDYGNDTWARMKWEWIDGNLDGTAECYYFNYDGYALVNTTTPDNYTVNERGAWVKDGLVQTIKVETDKTVWKRALIAEINRLKNGYMSDAALPITYWLMYVDEDNIPEILVYQGRHSIGSRGSAPRLLVYTNGEIKIESFYRDMLYVPKRNIVSNGDIELIGSCSMGRLVNGVLIEELKYGMTDFYNDKYYWNDETVTYHELERRYNEWVKVNVELYGGFVFHGEDGKTREEIIADIEGL